MAKLKLKASKFVAMKKDGETIEVNPLCVDDHKKLGWAVVGAQPGATEDAPADEGDEQPTD